MKSHLYEAKFFIISIIAFALHCGLTLFTCIVSLKDVHCILLPQITHSSHLICLVADFVPILHTYSSCWEWYCPFRFARTYTAKTTPKCPSLELADSRATAPQRKEQTEHSCLIPRLSNYWPLFLWHPISDTTLLRTVRAATQPDLLAIGPLGHLHPASGLFLLQEAELKLSRVTWWDTNHPEGTMLLLPAPC